MRSRLITFFISFIIWIMLSFKFDWQHVLTGLLVAFLVSFLMGDMFTGSPHKWLQPKRYFWFLVYIFIFIKECVKANLDVAFRVLNPRLPINPGIVKVKTKLKTETALTMLSNSITLTPGTLCVDIDDSEGVLYIHWIDVKITDIDKTSQMIVGKFENILGEIFE
ncbi:MAG: Na+/H+ antiporter subunit E [Candidatus Omnitrophica bacterium]|nr:Na+/H+ antiporter subunit E [Candidatus Omnitrophota bacterium]